MIDASESHLRWALPADHPVFPGHFPGQPIIPGAMLLDRVVLAIAERLGRHPDRLLIDSAKFLHPAGPDDELEIVLSENDSRWRFTLKTADRTVASGTISLAQDKGQTATP